MNKPLFLFLFLLTLYPTTSAQAFVWKAVWEQYKDTVFLPEDVSCALKYTPDMKYYAKHLEDEIDAIPQNNNATEKEQEAYLTQFHLAVIEATAVLKDAADQGNIPAMSMFALYIYADTINYSAQYKRIDEDDKDFFSAEMKNAVILMLTYYELPRIAPGEFMKDAKVQKWYADMDKPFAYFKGRSIPTAWFDAAETNAESWKRRCGF